MKKITIPFLLHFCGKNLLLYLLFIVSVSADMKNAISVFYWYRPIRKLRLSGFIGIGRYEKKLIGRTLAILMLMLHVISCFQSTICNSIGFYPILASKFETWARYHGTNTNLFLTPTSNFPIESDLKKTSYEGFSSSFDQWIK